jgi:hypothetical protein
MRLICEDLRSKNNHRDSGLPLGICNLANFQVHAKVSLTYTIELSLLDHHTLVLVLVDIVVLPDGNGRDP